MAQSAKGLRVINDEDLEVEVEVEVEAEGINCIDKADSERMQLIIIILSPLCLRAL